MLEAFMLVYYMGTQMLEVQEYASQDECIHAIEEADDGREYDCILILPEGEVPMDW